MSPARKRAESTTSTCPWCSAAVPAEATGCPSCGAALRDAVDGDVAGLTQIDHAAVSKASRIKPGRLTSWLGAESTVNAAPVVGGRIEPLSEEVRREMLRIELAAIDAEIEAKANAAALQRDLPPDDAPLDAPLDAPVDAPGDAGDGAGTREPKSD